MRQMSWRGSDGYVYRVAVFQEPFDAAFQTISFQREQDGWIGATSYAAGYDLLDLLPEQLEILLKQAKGGEG